MRANMTVAHKGATLKKLTAVSAGLLMVGLLAACSGSGKPKPTPLESFTPSKVVQVAWTAKVGESKEPLSLSVNGTQVTAASAQGQLTTLDATTGQIRWRAEVGAPISAGVGSDGRYSAVVTSSNELVVLQGANALWRERLPGRVVTAPLVAGDRIFVQMLDRGVRAYDAANARWLWQYQRAGGDPLALAQPGVLSAFRDTLLVGVGARLVGLDPTRGTVRFEASLGVPRGSNEVERLADLIGPAVRIDDDVCVRAFQLSVGCVDMNRGTLRWSRPQAGQQGLAGAGDVLVGADSAGRLVAWRSDTGETLWRMDRLQHRGLSTPALWNDLVVVGDFEGQLHFLSAQDGRTVARVSLDDALNGPPRVVDGSLLVATRAGTLYALRSR